MNSRTTWILGVVLLVLVGYLVISNRTAGEEAAEATVPPDPTPVPRTQVLPETEQVLTPVRLELSGTDEEGNLINRVYMAGEGGIWAQIVPTATQLISGSIVSQATAMLNISSRLVLPADENPLSAYGLDDPTYVIIVVADRNGESVRYVFNVGATIVGETGYYLQRQGDERVYVVDRTAVDGAIALLTAVPVPPPTIITVPFTNTLPFSDTAPITPTISVTSTVPVTSTIAP
ncbi:MAG: DUF4340 domain-containing protein [Candidatus Promineifilaceae bacterium]